GCRGWWGGVGVMEPGAWYGEGEVKVYRDGDASLPTICGTGLEDYVGTAWGMGAHAALYAGAPLEVRDPAGAPNPVFVGFYRWHLADPIVFATDLRVTLQQIGFAAFASEAERRRYRERQPPGRGRRAPAPTAAPPPSSPAARRRRCRASTSPPRPPTSRGARGRRRRPSSSRSRGSRIRWPPAAPPPRGSRARARARRRRSRAARAR